MNQRVVSRRSFEEWISAPPYEQEVLRYPDDETECAWPGQYRIIAVQLAWEAWCESANVKVTGPGHMKTPELKPKCDGRVSSSELVMSDDKIMDAMEDDGWLCNRRGWWHPPSCLAAWPLDEAKRMWQRDRAQRKYDTT